MTSPADAAFRAGPPAADERAALADAVGKVRRRVLPLLVVMFIVNYLDRVNVGFIKAPLAATLGIDAAAFGFGAGLFFIGYLLFEVPSNLALERFGGRVWLARIAISWGLVAAGMCWLLALTPALPGGLLIVAGSTALIVKRFGRVVPGGPTAPFDSTRTFLAR